MIRPCGEYTFLTMANYDIYPVAKFAKQPLCAHADFEAPSSPFRSRLLPQIQMSNAFPVTPSYFRNKKKHHLLAIHGYNNAD